MVNKVINIPAQNMQQFFELWLTFLKPIHKLSEKPIKVLAALLTIRHNLSKDIINPEVLDSVVLNLSNKKKAQEMSDLTNSYFQVIMNQLRKKKIIINDRINPKFIPNIKTADKFQLLILFDIKNESTTTVQEGS